MKPAQPPRATSVKQIHCPLNGWRNLSEFAYGGELHDMPSPNKTSAKEWAEYVFFHDNPAGRVIEWWCHTPTTFWFLVERNTVTNEFVRSFLPSEYFTARVDFKHEDIPGESS